VHRTGDQQARADSAGISEGVGFIRYFLLAFAAIALAVGSFVIYNTITITLAQRFAHGVSGHASAKPYHAATHLVAERQILGCFTIDILHLAAPDVQIRAANAGPCEFDENSTGLRVWHRIVTQLKISTVLA